MNRLQRGGQQDPYIVPELGFGHLPGRVTSGLALRAQTVNPAIRNLIDITLGQSNGTNIAPSAYTPSNPTALDNFNVYDGAIYEAKDPLLGCDLNTAGPGNHSLRLGDSLVSAGLIDRYIAVPLSINAADVAFWQGPLGASKLPTAIRRLADRGIVTGTNVTIIIRFIEGESDNLALTSQVNFASGARAIFATARNAGFTGPIFVPLQTYINGTSSATIRSAQSSLVDHSSGIYAGPDADALVGSVCSGVACRQSDLTHWSDAGSASYAAAWRTALAAYGAPFV